MKPSLSNCIAALVLALGVVPSLAADKGTQKTQDLKKTVRPAGSDLVSPNGGIVTLTGAQCTGLGGKEQVFFKCFPNLACVTVDPAGVVRKVCITGSN